MENIKWSKKEVVERPTQDRWGNDLPNYPLKVNVYRWKSYRLEKELYGENRLFYHIAKDNLVRKLLTADFPNYENSEERSTELYSIGETPLYLCDYNGSLQSPHAQFFSTIKEATQWLKFFLESDEEESIGVWINPKEKHIWGVLSYKPKRKKPLLFWDGVDRKIKLNKASK